MKPFFLSGLKLRTTPVWTGSPDCILSAGDNLGRLPFSPPLFTGGGGCWMPAGGAPLKPELTGPFLPLNPFASNLSAGGPWPLKPTDCLWAAPNAALYPPAGASRRGSEPTPRGRPFEGAKSPPFLPPARMVPPGAGPPQPCNRPSGRVKTLPLPKSPFGAGDAGASLRKPPLASPPPAPLRELRKRPPSLPALSEARKVAGPLPLVVAPLKGPAPFFPANAAGADDLPPLAGHAILCLWGASSP
mmetsp:Transcript_130286/g.309167  ORF Transcript_130286/g.309167 Transcript_130286/m.309167 type:complete len:245 (-) Transcript_130286:10-744(-)